MKQEKKISVALVIALIALAVTFKCIELKYSDLPIGLSIKEKLLFCWSQPFNKYSAFCIGTIAFLKVQYSIVTLVSKSIY